jgi:hypothetical protein
MGAQEIENIKKEAQFSVLARRINEACGIEFEAALEDDEIPENDAEDDGTTSDPEASNPT